MVPRNRNGESARALGVLGVDRQKKRSDVKSTRNLSRTENRHGRWMCLVSTGRNKGFVKKRTHTISLGWRIGTDAVCAGYRHVEMTVSCMEHAQSL